MANLYKQLAPVYEAMYQTFINYPKEFAFYSNLLQKYDKKEVLEIGSGTGNLAKLFLKNGFSYQGLDYSVEMLGIAKKKVPNGVFLEGDMRSFKLKNPVESIIITGRTISYLVKNEDINATFSKIHKNLKPKGILCFDFINASRFIPPLANGKTLNHEASWQNIHYLRENHWSLDLKNGMTFRWNSTYYQKTKDGLKKLGVDDSVVRTFTLQEIEIFLTINHFEIKEVIDRPAYAFPTLVIVAEKLK